MGRIDRPMREDAVAEADQLDGGCRPYPGRVPGAEAGRWALSVPSGHPFVPNNGDERIGEEACAHRDNAVYYL